MASKEVKSSVLARLEELFLKRQEESDDNRVAPLVQAENLRGVRYQLGYKEEISCTQLGDALRSLHNKGELRCARPRRGPSEPRPYAIYFQPAMKTVAKAAH